MIRFFFLFLFLCLSIKLNIAHPTLDRLVTYVQPSILEESLCRHLYLSMQLEGTVSWHAFQQAVHGYRRIKHRQRDVLTLIDFSKPSTQNRLFVFDMQAKKLLHASLVAHGRNSGGMFATSFSNEQGSFKSSLGFFLTGSTYDGKNGYSLLLDGLEKGVNDHARERSIVVHGADYANPSVIASGGRLGRSLGCPALPQEVSRSIIDDMKGGSVLFIYAKAPAYFSQSAYLEVKSSQI